MKLRVGVLFGGKTVEHEVGIISALHAMEHLNKEKYEIIPIYMNKDNVWYTSKTFDDINVFKNYDNIANIANEVVLVKKGTDFVLKNNKSINLKKDISVDVILLIAHGKGVEDGVISGHLQMLGIPFTAPNVIGAAIGQDKVLQKLVLSSSGIKVPDYVWFYDSEFINNEDEILKKIIKLKFPVIVKPANLGSSIGINVARDKEELIEYINEAINYDTKIIVEKIISNIREVDCAVIGNSDYQEVSEIGEVKNEESFFTFEEKYLSEGGKKGDASSKSCNGFVFPADLPKKQIKEIQDISKEAFRVLNLKGITRFDYLIDSKSGDIYLNEPNTIPGLLAFFFFKNVGKTYDKLLDQLIEIAIDDFKKDSRKVVNFDSNILSTYNGVKFNK